MPHARDGARHLFSGEYLPSNRGSKFSPRRSRKVSTSGRSGRYFSDRQSQSAYALKQASAEAKLGTGINARIQDKKKAAIEWGQHLLDSLLGCTAHLGQYQHWWHLFHSTIRGSCYHFACPERVPGPRLSDARIRKRGQKLASGLENFSQTACCREVLLLCVKKTVGI